jgi:hypothetical protein
MRGLEVMFAIFCRDAASNKFGAEIEDQTVAIAMLEV